MAHVFRKGLLSPFEEMNLILFKVIGPPHLGVRLPLKVVTTPLDILGVVYLHLGSRRTPKHPLYIRLYFLSPLLFFGSLLALGYQKEMETRSSPRRSFLDAQSYSGE